MIRFHVLHSFSMITVLAATWAAAFPTAAQGPVPLNDATVEAVFIYPVTTDSALVSFDWDANGDLHYSVGNPSWGTKLEVYKQSGSESVQIFSSATVWAGSRLTRIGNALLFNDGGNSTRADFNYYGYDPAHPETVFDVLQAPYEASLWGLETRQTGEFFASGSATTWGPGALFYGMTDEAGQLVSRPLIQFGEVGDSPGPLAFDASGNLYYVPGYAYSGTASLFRWNAAEVEAALADPEGASLSPENHAWNVLPVPYSGATGMVTDEFGNVYVTATAWGSPSQVLLYAAASSAPLAVAEYSGRLETLRYRDHAVHFSCAEGVFKLPVLQVRAGTDTTEIHSLPGETVLFSVEATGGMGARHYQWYRKGPDKADIPVGNDLAYYSMTVRLADSGSVFYCEVSDGAYTVESPQFLLTVEEPVPARSTAMLAACALLLAISGARLAGRRTVRGR